MSAGIDVRARLLLCLAEADQSFASTGDHLEALGWVRLAIKNGMPLPPALREWVCTGIETYVSNTDAKTTLGAALGLKETRRADPRLLPRKGHGAKWAALARMFELQVAGATVRPAAELVASLAGVRFSAETLEQAYRRSGYGAMVEASQGFFHPSQVRRLLDQFPDKTRMLPDLAKHKKGILAMYAKARR